MTTTPEPTYVTTKHLSVGDQVADAKGGRPKNGPGAFATILELTREPSRVSLVLDNGRTRQFGTATKLFRIPGAGTPASPAPKAPAVKVPAITRAARRDLLAAHANGGHLEGMCYGPAKSLSDHGLLAGMESPANASGYTIVLSPSGLALAEHLSRVLGSADGMGKLVEAEDKAKAAKAVSRSRHPHALANGATLTVVPDAAPAAATGGASPAPAPAAPAGKRLTEDEVVQWINRTRAADPGASWVKMTKAIRAAGRSCSNARFRRILGTIPAPVEAVG